MKITNNFFKSGIFRFLLITAVIGIAAIAILFMVAGKKLLRISEKVPVAGSILDVRDYGRGKPTVIIEAGLNCSKHLYYWFQVKTSGKVRVIAYDHAGIGGSEPNSNPRTLPFYVEELKELLKLKGVEPPYILVGHSLGGHIIRYYTHLYPDEVAGLIFIDHPHEDWFRYIRSTWNEEDQNRYFRFWDPNFSNYKNTGLKELIEYEANCDSVRGKVIPLDIPVLMFTGNNKGHFRKTTDNQVIDMNEWIRLQHQIIENVTNAKQIVDWEAGHLFHIDKPKMVQTEVNQFIEKIVAGNKSK